MTPAKPARKPATKPKPKRRRARSSRSAKKAESQPSQSTDQVATALDGLFRPRSVAVIGASRRAQQIGHQVVANLVDGGFQGPVHPVNPSAAVVRSMHCHKRVHDIPDPVDLAVLVVPASAVLRAAKDCAAAGVKGLVVISAGFSEVGAAGAARQAELTALCKKHHMRLVGPNCMGVLNTDPAVCLNASFAASPPEPGGAAFLSQSGALGEAILSDARSLGLGVSMFASLGNRADVSPSDLLEYWEHDPATQQILMYLEAFGDPERFMQAARRVSRTKPILVVKAGRSARGAAAAISHTGSLAGSEAAVDSLLNQCGVLRVDTMNHLFALASAVQAGAFPKGNRVAIVTNAGGPAILATDACVAAGLDVGDLSEKTRAKLATFLPPEASLANPVDLIAGADAAVFDKALAAVLSDRRVDMVIAIFVSPVMIDSSTVAKVIAKHFARSSKPITACLLGKDKGEQALATLREAGVPHYRFPEEAARVLAGLTALQRLQSRPDEPAPPLKVRSARARAVIASALADNRATLKGVEMGEVLTAYGLPIVPTRIVSNREQALQAARKLGFPLVAKVVAEGIEHKSDRGGVLLDLRNRDELLDAYDRLEDAFGQEFPGMLVMLQAMRSDGVEVFFGAATDPQLGRLLAFGLGGIHVEILKDVIFRLHPINAFDAREMVQGIRGRAMLQGARGKPPVDEAQLIDVLLRTSRMLSDIPEIVELDFNPYLAAWDRKQSCILDARVRLAPA